MAYRRKVKFGGKGGRVGNRMHTERPRSLEGADKPGSIYFFSAGFPNVNVVWFGAPNPNADGVLPLCPVVAKLNGDEGPPPVDVEGVTGVNTNAGGLEPLVPFVVTEVVVVPGVLELPKENAGLFVAGAGVGCVAVVVPNALTGVDVVPNAFPFVSGLGPGLKASCLGAGNENTFCEAPVVVGVVEFEGGRVTFESDPPAGLLVAKLKRG